MAEVMLALGDYRFSIESATYETFRQTTNYRWPSQARLSQVPARQFVGMGEETIELSGVIYPHYAGGFDQLEDLKNEAGKGEPLLLTDGLGRVWGQWVVLSIQEERSALFANGTPRKLTFTITIARYG